MWPGSAVLSRRTEQWPLCFATPLSPRPLIPLLASLQYLDIILGIMGSQTGDSIQSCNSTLWASLTFR